MQENQTENFIEIQDLSFRYEGAEDPEHFVLKNINLGIAKGSFVCIIGHNGSGKSTLGKCFNALHLPTKGKVLINGMDTADEKYLWEIRKSCGMVFQNPDNQLVSSIVEDDVAFGPENLGVAPEEIRVRVDNALNAVNMYSKRKKGPHLLSGGQKQRVAIAGVLAMEPDCIVFDEPTAMLDPAGRKDIMEIIHKLHEEGKTIVLITHFMDETVKADRIIIMDKGRIAADGSPAEIYSDTERLKELGLHVPFAADLAAKLRNDGLDIPADIITEEDLAEAICRLK